MKQFLLQGREPKYEAFDLEFRASALSVIDR